MARRLQFWQSASVLLLLVAGIVLSVVLFRPAQALTEEQPGRFSRLHIVGKGEDLASIASHGEYPVHLLKELNGLAPEHELWVGQPLQLPSPEPSGETLASVNQYHRVLLGETLHQIANYYGLHPIELAHINRLSPNDLLYTGQLIRVPNAVVWTRLQETGYMSQFDSYEMQEADTLESVAEHFEVSAKSIRSFNALQPTDSPLPGD